MAELNKLPGAVNILGREHGELINQFPQGADRVVNLSQSSIVRINASPDSVSYYQRQGDDLIIHMKDGSTVRYQHFFTLDASGHHSELIFDDISGSHHALFPFANEPGSTVAQTIVPGFTDTTAAAAEEGISSGVLWAGAGLLAVGGGIALAAGGGGGGSDSSNNGGNGNNGGDSDGDGTVGGGTHGGTTTPSTLTVGTLAGDNILNSSESKQTQTLSGKTEVVNAGRTVSLTLDGHTWNGVVGSDGKWAITITANILELLSGGAHTFTVSMVDKYGHTITRTNDFTVNLSQPEPTINAPFSDSYLNLAEQGQSQLITGKTGFKGRGQTVDLVFNGVSYTATVDNNGNWKVTLPASALKGVPDGQSEMTVIVTDAAGNQGMHTEPFTVDTVKPILTVAPLGNDGVVDSLVLAQAPVLRGTTDLQDVGDKITVTLNGKTYTATVGANGDWQVSLPTTDLKSLPDANYNYNVVITDAAGNTNSVSGSFMLNQTTPKISINTFADDNYLNGAELRVDETLSGKTANVAAGSTVTITLGGKTGYTTVSGDGSWHITLAKGDLDALSDGIQQIKASVGLNVTATQNITIDHAMPGVAIAIISTDDYLNAADAQQPLTINGVTKGFPDGAKVTVTFGGKAYSTQVVGEAWSVTIPKAALAGLKDGPLDVQAQAASGGLSATDSHTLTVLTTQPNPMLNTPFGDGILNGQEEIQPQILSGNTGSNGADQKVAVTLGDKQYTTTADGQGNWHLTVPPADLQALAEGAVSVNISVTDAAGNSATLNTTTTVDSTAPTLSVLPFAGDDWLNLAETTKSQTLSGITSQQDSGQKVTVSLNGKTYTAVVGIDGKWQISVPAADLAKLADGKQTFDVQLADKAGNIATVEHTFTVKTVQPTLTVAVFAGDDKLDGAEAKTDQTLKGTTTHTEVGSTILVMIGTSYYTTTVAADGSWNVVIPAADLGKLPNGLTSIAVTVQDLAGQSASTTHNVSVDTTQHAIAISIVSTDDYLNHDEAALPLTISGQTIGVAEAATVTITLHGKTYTVTVQREGSWSTQVLPGDLQALNDGIATITASVGVGAGQVSATHDLNVLTHTLPDVALNPLFGDGVLSQSESLQNQPISGATGITGPGQTVLVQVGGQNYNGQVDAQGNWTVTLPTSELQGLADGSTPMAVTVKDVAGNSDTLNASLVVDKTPPQLTINAFASDDKLSLAEAATAQTFSGTAIGAEPRQPVTIILNGKTYNTVVGSLGGWETTVLAADLQALGDGKATFTVTVSDKAGNTTTIMHTIDTGVDPSSQPLLNIAPIAVNNVVDGAEKQHDTVVKGTSLNVEAGQTVTIAFDGSNYAGLVQSDGSWAVTLPQAVMQALTDGDHSLTASVSDVAGNTFTQRQNFTVDSTVSAITVAPLGGDDTIGVADLNGGLVINGNSVNLATGTPLVITFNGKQYSATTAADGTWSTTIPKVDAQEIADGKATVVVSAAQDQAGNPVTSSHDFTIITHVLPLVTLTPPFGDGTLNGHEAATGGTLSGTTGVTGSGQVVTVMLGGTPYAAVVDANGNWSRALPTTVLQGLADGTVPLVVKATDIAGNTNTFNGSVLVDTTPPALIIHDITADNIVNTQETGGILQITGTVSPVDANFSQTVTVTVNGQTYTGTVLSNGSWSIPLPAGALSGAGDGPLNITATVNDAAGNVGNASHTFTLDASAANAPLIQVGTVSGDDYLNATEAGSALAISGTTTRVEAGQTVTLTLNGKTYSATVQPDGRWATSVPAVDVAKLPDGAQNIVASVTDVAGNPANNSHIVTIIAQVNDLPKVQVNTIAGDDMINGLEHNSPLTITGTSAHLTVGQQVSVMLNNQRYTGTVDASGNWSVNVPAADVQALGNQVYTVTATALDVAKNVATDAHQVTVDTVPPLLSVNAGFLVDGKLNYNESLADQILSGKSEPGLTVSLAINGKTLHALTDPSGNWSITLAAVDLQTLPQGSSALSVTVVDPAGNGAQSLVPINVGTLVLPALTLDKMFTDNILSIGEANAGGTLTGSASHLAANTVVTVNIGNLGPFSGTVDGLGHWSVNVPVNVLRGLADGQVPVTVAAADTYGNVATVGGSLDALVHTNPNAALTLPLFADNRLNLAEAQAGQVLTGNTGLTGSGQNVSLAIDGGAPITGAVDANGNWTVQLAPGVLQGLADGTHTLEVTVTDRAGNIGDSGSLSFTAQTHVLPTPTLTMPFGDGVLNAIEAGGNGSIGGGTGIAFAKVQTVMVSVNNGAARAATVNPDGTWSLALTSTELQNYPDGNVPVKVTVTDNAGNVVSVTDGFAAHTHTVPVITIDTPFADSVLNYAEATRAGGQTISGNTGSSGTGQKVTVSINGTTVDATVQANGDWSALFTTGNLTGMTNGATYPISVTAKDVYQNSATSSADFTVHTTQPNPTIDPLFGDTFLNISEAASAQQITGTTGITGAGQAVKVTIGLNGVVYNAAVTTGGVWSVELPGGALQGLIGSTHNVVVTATDAWGNAVSTNTDFTTVFSAPTVALTSTIFGDGIIGISEAAGVQTLSGTLTTGVASGTKVTVNIGGKDFTASVTGNTWALVLNGSDHVWDGVSLGKQTITVTVIDGAGNTGTDSEPVTILLAQPTLSLTGLFAGDGTLTYEESQHGQTISGTSSNLAAGSTVTVTLGGQVFSTTTQGDGAWTLMLTPPQLAALPAGSGIALAVTATDAAGNVATPVNEAVNISHTPLPQTVTIDVVGGDNYLNINELSGTVTITGKASGITGDVILALNGLPIGTATVSGGVWSLTLDAGDKILLTQGNNTLTATTVLGALGPDDSLSFVVDTVRPTININAFAGDDKVLNSEIQTGQLLSGTSTVADAGRVIQIQLNGKSYQATVQGNGSWSVTVPQADMAALPQGGQNITLTLTDAAGNEQIVTHPITVDSIAPLLTVDALGVGNVLTAAEVLAGLPLTGRGDPGDTVKITLGPLSATALVDGTGHWNVSFPTLDLKTLTDGAQVIGLSVTDANGNITTANVALNVALNQSLGVLLPDIFGGDGVLNVAESLVAQVLTGQATGDYRGASVTLSVLGFSVTVPVGADGSWSASIPPSLWVGLTQNTAALDVSIKDANGNVVNNVVDIGLALTNLPVVSDVIAATDNIINKAETNVAQTVSGAVSGVAAGTRVVLQLAGQTITTVVDATGHWVAQLPTAMLASLPDGSATLKVSVMDTAGNIVNSTVNLQVLTHNLPTITLDPLFGDGVLSITELVGGLISGTATGLNGQSISVNINGATQLSATVDNSGKWSATVTPDLIGVLQGLGDGAVSVTASATDTAGNLALSAGVTLQLNLLAPVLNGVTLFGDGLLNAVDATLNQTIVGSVLHAPEGSSVSVALGGKTFLGVVGRNGGFTIHLSPADMAGLGDGTLTPVVTIRTVDGNSAVVNAPSVTIGITHLPSVVLNSVFGGDGFLNKAEVAAGQLLSGKVTGLSSGTVNVQVGSLQLTAQIQSDGNWSLPLATVDLSKLPDGNLTVSASVTDGVGNTASTSQVLSALFNTLPGVSLNSIFGDGRLNIGDLLSAQLISGTTTNVAAGSNVAITLGALSYTATVGANGIWQVSVPTVDLKSLFDGNLAVSAKVVDAAGNTASASAGLNVAISALPTLVVNTLFGDGGLNAADILSDKVISGSATNAPGSLVNVSLGGKTYTATVGSDGNWSLTVPKIDLSALADGALTLNASLTNPAGNSVSTGSLLNVITHSLPIISLGSLFGGDGYLNISEADSGQTLSGKITSGIADGAKVVVSLGGTPYNAIVAADGSWTLPLTNAQLEGLQNGALHVGVTVTDKVGNTNATGSDVTVKLTTPGLSFNALASLNLITLLTKGLTISGGSANLGAGAVVHIGLLNNTVNATAITDSNGNWQASLGLSLNLLELLSLSSAVNLYASDFAGNTGYLNVGLGGGIISTTPPAGTQAAQSSMLMSAMVETSHTGDDTSPPHSNTMPDSTPITENTQTTQESSDAGGAYTIGSLSIDLADGSHASGETVHGGAGNDTVHLSTLGFVQIDGGDGTDTLVLEGANMNLNLVTEGSKIQHIEIFDLGLSGNNGITLDLNEALNVTDKSQDDLLIKGTTGDQVNLVHGTGDVWEVSGQREVNGVEYDVYHNNSQLSTNTLGDVLVQQGLHVNLV